MTDIRSRIVVDMKVAMKEKKPDHVQALKLVFAECRNKEIELKKPLNDLQMVTILRKQIKQYEESIEQYKKIQRQEAISQQKVRLDLIKSYLPRPLSEKEILLLIDKKINQLEATSIKQMGLVIKSVQESVSGAVDGAFLAQLVKKRLQNL